MALASEPGEVLLAPDADAVAWVAAVEPDGARYVVRGSMRARMTGESFLWSEDRFAAPITVAASVDDGWLFVAADGAVARSATFLGPLEPLGDLGFGGRAIDTGGSRGRVALVDDEGTLRITDGRTAFAPARGLPDATRVVGACFADAAHGAAIVDGGELFATRDGGGSWQPVDGRGEAAWATYVSADGRLVVRTTGGARALEPDGTLAPLAQPAVREDHGRLEPDAQRSVLLAALRTAPAMALASWGEPARADGTVLLADRDDVLAIEAGTGRIARTNRGALPELGCRLAPWGSAVAARCPSGLFRSTDGGESFAPVATRPDGSAAALPLDLLLSDDGAHAVGRGPVCGGASLGALCVLDPEARRWRLLDAPRPSGVFSELFDLHGERLLAGLALVEARVGVVETDAGSVQALRVGDEPSARGLEVVRANWLGDSIVAIGAPSAEQHAPRFLLMGSAEGLVGARPLPGGTVAVAFASPLRGVAVGRDAGLVFRTLDGGATWAALPLPLRGDANATSVAPIGGTLAPAHCTASGCVVGRRVVVNGWGPIAPADERALAANRAPTAPEFPRFDHVAATPPACEPVGPPATSTVLPPGAAPRIGARRVTLSVSAAVARVDAWRDARTGTLMLEALWRLDGDARFVGRTRATALALASPDADLSDAPASRYALRGATRRGLLLERCPAGRHERACQLFWAPNRGAITPVAPREAFADAMGSDVVTEQSLPLADGGLSLVLRSTAPATAVDLAIELGPDGRVRHRRAFAWHASRAAAERVLVRWRGAVYYTVLETAASPGLRRPPLALRLAPLGEGLPSTTLFVGGSLAARVCRGPIAPGAVELETTRAGALASLLLGRVVSPHEGPRTARARVELAAGSACLRAVTSDVASPDAPEPATRWTGDGVHLEADPSGALAGAIDDGAARHLVRCGP